MSARVLLVLAAFSIVACGSPPPPTTGVECFLHRPAICECGSASSGVPLCGFDCGNTCSARATCVDFRCVEPDAGIDGGSPDGG